VEQLRVAKVAAEQRAQEIEERDRELRQKMSRWKQICEWRRNQQALMPSTYPTFPQTPPRARPSSVLSSVISRLRLMGGDFFHIARLNEDRPICICDVWAMASAQR